MDEGRRTILRDGLGLLGASAGGLLGGWPLAASAAAAAPAPAAAPHLALGALVCDTYNAYRWSPPSPTNTWNVLQGLRDNGVEWVRMWTTTQSFPQLRTTSDWSQIPWQNGFWSCQEVACGILSAAAAKGFRLQAVLFVNDQSAAAGNQPLPAAWAGLSPAQLADQVRISSAATAAYFKSAGLNIEVFEIGNEIDFGFCGIQLGKTATPPPGVDWTTDAAWMHDSIWGPMAPLLNAAIEGVRSVYPDAKTLLHIAGSGYSPGDVLTPAFFQSMIASGVPYDIAGLSYPYLIVPSPVVPQPYFTQPGFQNALAGIAALGKPVQVVEFNYPASPNGVAQSQSASPLYPLTPDGQANFIRDFASALLGKVERLFYWYPDYYPTFRNGANPELESCGLFSAKDVPRPALAMLNQIASAGIASQNDCLFNWAERQYAGYFPPGTASGGTYPPYNYRYYPGTGNYLAVSSADNHVYVRGPSFGAGTIDVGPASTFLSLSSCS